jgi:hypothetical protein
LFGVLAQVVRNGLVDVPVGLLTRDDWPGFHPRALGFARPRTRSRSASK